MTLEWRRLCRKISMDSDPNIPALLIYISAMLETSLHVWSLPGLPAAPGQLFGVHPPQLVFGVHPSQHFLMSIWAFSGVHLSFLLSHPWHIHPVLSLAACTAAPSWLCCSTCLVPSVPSSSCDLITCCSSMELSLISSFFFSAFVPFVTLAWTHTTVTRQRCWQKCRGVCWIQMRYWSFLSNWW